MTRPAPHAVGSHAARAPTAGFTLVELLISMVVMSIVIVGVGNFFAAFKRATLQEELTASLEANLRVAMEHLAFNLRNARSGVPQTNLAAWVPWVGLNNPLLITQGSGSSDPDSVSLAFCTPKPIATLSLDAATTAASLTLVSESDSTMGTLLNNTNKRLIRIGDVDFAHVTGVTAVTPAPGNPNSTATVAIDAAPAGTGDAAGLSRAYFAGTPVCRVDVMSFTVDPTDPTAPPIFRIDEHHGNGAQPAVDGITNLQIQIAVNQQQHTITLTGRSDKIDPDTRAYITRALQSTITLRNN